MWREPGVRNSDCPCSRPAREGVPTGPPAMGLVGHSSGDTNEDLTTAVTEVSPGVAAQLSGPVPCPSQLCWVGFGSSIGTDEDPRWLWGLSRALQELGAAWAQPL